MPEGTRAPKSQPQARTLAAQGCHPQLRDGWHSPGGRRLSPACGWRKGRPRCSGPRRAPPGEWLGWERKESIGQSVDRRSPSTVCPGRALGTRQRAGQAPVPVGQTRCQGKHTPRGTRASQTHGRRSRGADAADTRHPQTARLLPARLRPAPRGPSARPALPGRLDPSPPSASPPTSPALLILSCPSGLGSPVTSSRVWARRPPPRCPHRVVAAVTWSSEPAGPPSCCACPQRGHSVN